MLANGVAFTAFFITYRDIFFFANYVVFNIVFIVIMYFHVFESLVWGCFFFSNICPSILENKIESVNQI